jgi:formylglycine-generating enzyme required for sulfatase activity
MRTTPSLRFSILGAALMMAILARSGAAAETAAPKRTVLCWYMVCYGNSVEGYKQEIELAQRHGIDGFLLDVGEWQTGSPTALKPTHYVQSAERMYEAARQLGTGFLLAMAPEYSVQPFPENVHDMVQRFRNHPNQLRHNGKVVLSGYCGASMFLPAMEKFKAEGVPVCLVPHIFLPRFLYNPSIENFADEFAAAPCLDGLMMFNPIQLGNVISDNASGRRATLKLGKVFAACVTPAYNSANLQDYRGLSGYLAMWQGAINDGADWISIVIWNDYNEDSGLMPSHWPSGSERFLYDRDESFLDATAYASAWFKTGRPPAITQDKLFVTYRNRSKWLRKAWDGKKWIDLSLQTGVKFDQIHDDVEDLVYVDTFLTSPASVAVCLADKTQRFDLPAGIGHAEVPMTPGVPRLTLQRENKVLAEVVGRKLIVGEPTERNSLMVGDHPLNRTWVSGTAIGPVVRRIEAESGTLGPGASVVSEGSVKAVQNAAVKESGFTVPVQGLATATYNVRIVYCNPSNEEARLTLFADGPPRDKADHPYFIPAYLPPTGQGKFQTVSFFWSLYDTTRTLKLQWQPGQSWGQPNPVDDDHGIVLIDAIELVKVEPVVPVQRESNLPELVWIPGGKFSMGSDRGEPDERPRHMVTVSGFAMGKYEVTNVEFERFDPAHRAVRNGNSWRNREPVLHVSWLDAARYCNWLSAQAGLTPSYSEQVIDPTKPGEKFWVANLKGEGFRLPTEAEWEYAATGRGEDRTYPWGEATPVPEFHGRFQGRTALGARMPHPANEQSGAVVVGSYPAGASRDGVMDLSGNVAEWCNDWYDYYSSDAQADPCQTKPGNYRVIRGGSWSWYNHSQRNTDREFNSQNYPGHAYYGFRVVLPEAGWNKRKNQP